MAKFRITPSSKAIMQLPISIGHKAEKGVEAIEFDVTAWVETYGSGTLTVIMRRWGDTIPYPIVLEIDENNKATWTLSDIDTAKAGMAYAQLSYIVGDEVVKKSDIYTFRVMDSLTGEGEPPEAYESWLENLTHLAAEAMAEVLDIEGIVTDKTLTVDGGIADGKATGDALALKADKSTTYTKTEVDQMIADVEVETDPTLSISGAPADAAETGRQFGLINESLGSLTEPQRLADGTDLDTVLTPGVYMLHTDNSYLHKPTADSEHGILEVWHEVFGNNVGRTFQRLTYTYKAGRTSIEVWVRTYSAFTSTWNAWVSTTGDLSRKSMLLSDDVPNTTQSYTFTDGKVSQVTHSRNSVAIRTDVFTYGTGTITEVRTLSTGESLTIVTDLTTLETTVTYNGGV